MGERDHAAHPPGEPEAAAQDTPVTAEDGNPDAPAERDEGPVRRPLIRATLKPPEGTPPPAQQAPVFTMHEPRGGSGQSRGNSRPRNSRPGRDNGHPNKTNGKSRSRSRSGSSRRGKGRSR